MTDSWALPMGPMLQRGLLEEATNVTAAGSPSSNQEVRISVALLTQLVLLGFAFIIGRALERNKVTWIGEAGAALVMGILVGAFLRADFFVLVLLPPIMFESGFAMDMGPFIRNIASISSFAFLGTTISMLMIGAHMWLGGVWGMYTPLSFLEACLFGAMISATDPVTVLAVFTKLRAQEDLYIQVFGESVLNDAVGLVLFTTVAKMLEPGFDVNALSLLWGLWMFVYIFLASMILGCLFGAAAALLFKTQYFLEPEVMLEPALVIVTAFSCYFAAEAAGWSGIVAIVFCGIVMNRYVVPNISEEGEKHARAFFRIVASMCELFVFLYIGIFIFLVPQAWHVFGFTAWCLLSLVHSRALNIFPISAMLNFFSPPELRIPMNAQFMLWWSGLRGGMAFSLSVVAAATYGEKGRMMSTCTFLLVVLTVLINGGSSAYLLDKLKLRQPAARAVVLHAGNTDEDGWPETDIRSIVEAGHESSELKAVGHAPSTLVQRVRNYSKLGSLQLTLQSFDEKVLGRLLISPSGRTRNPRTRHRSATMTGDWTAASDNGDGQDDENMPLTNAMSH